MGLDVSHSKVVTLNDTHERRLNTAGTGRCYTFPAGAGVVVHCVFRRTLVGDGRDGIPLMYALKGTNGYSVDAASLLEIRRRAMAVAARSFAPGAAEVVVSAPSSSGVPAYLARMACRILGQNAVLANVLRKRTIGDVLATALPPGAVKRSDRRDYVLELGRLRGLDQTLDITLKAVPANVRHYFRTIELVPGARLPVGRRIIVVDDSASTGTTLRDSVQVLRAASAPTSAVGLTLVGPA